MKKRTVAGLIVAVVLTNLFALIAGSLAVHYTYKHVSDGMEMYDDARSYLDKLPHNESLIYAYRDIYKEGCVIKGSEKLKDEERILFVGESHVYIYSQGDDTDQIIRTDHHFMSRQVVLDVEGSSFSVIDGEIIVYKDERENVHAYYVNTKKDVVYKDADVYDVKKYLAGETKKYSCKSIGTDANEIYKITDQKGNIKLIEEGELDVLRDDPHVKKVEEALGEELELYRVCTRGDNIFVWLVSSERPLGNESLSLIYSYDFQKEEYTFVDWIELEYYSLYEIYYIGE